MSSTDQTVLTLRLADDAEVSDWLDSLAAHECTSDEFMAAVLYREDENPDIGWEALALLDQQFRRQKISHDVFVTVKARLQQHLLPAETVPPASAGPAENTIQGELETGDRLCNRYRVVDILRRTSSSTVVEATDEMKIEMPGARRRVAIQVMDETLSRDPGFLARIGKVQKLSHPAIARLFDVDEDKGALILVKELLNGPSLHDLLARKDGRLLHDSFVRSAVSSIASALAYAHSQGVTHGNVSTTNVFITHAGDVRLRGFEDALNPVEPAADRLAFAWLAYELLTGEQIESSKPGYGSGLRPPPGLARDKWCVLRDTLNGKSNRGNVLTDLADVSPVARRTPWAVAACVAATLGITAWLLVDKWPPTSDSPAAAAAVPATAVAAAVPIPDSAPPARSDAAPGNITPAIPPAVVPARSRIELPASTSTVETTARVARVWVRRRDNLHGAVTFHWWTESGTAEADREFRTVSHRMETIPDGTNGIEVLVPLIPDAARRETRTFYVKIDAPSPRAILGARTLMQVSIVPPDYSVAAR